MSNDQQGISSKLRFMDPQTLRQYGEMHKSDPYIFPLVFQESQNRQKVYMNQQMQMAGQQQPKVNEQALAQMAPPRAQPMPQRQGQGIVDLSAPNMETMADGGIAGYPDDDFVTRNQSVVMMAGGGHVPRYQGNPRDGSLVRLPYGGDTMGMPDPTQEALSALQAEEAGAATARTRKIAELEQQVAFLTAAGAPQAATVKAQLDALKAPTPLKGTMPEAGYTRGGFEGDPRLSTPPTQPVVAAPRPDTKRKDTTRKEPTAAAAAATEPSEKTDTGGLDSLISKFTRSTDLAQGALQNRRVELTNRMEQEALGEVEATKKRIKEEGDVFAGKEARLAAREKGIEGMGDKYMGLALLQAGAAMMSTPGNIGSVLGKGIAVGSERYIAGIDKINAAKDKFAEARDRLDDLRLNRDDMNKKEVRDAERAVRTARVRGQELLVDGATNDLKISNDNQKAIFGVVAENIQTDKRIKSAENISANELKVRERIANIPQGQERIASLLGGGDVEKGLVRFAEIQAGKFNPTTAYTEYLSKRKEGDSVLTPQQFVTQIKSIQALMGKTPPAAVDTSKPDRQ
jgi:hypothetical protein